MQEYKAQLRDCLEQSGWQVEEEIAGVDWWADEHWKVRSVWNLWGYELVITFLVDPHWEGTSKKRAAIWAVSATAALPSERPIGRDGETIAWLDMMRGRFDEKLQVFVAAINSHRDQSEKG
jgi:hypothetical protein